MAAFKLIETPQFIVQARRYKGAGKRWTLVLRNGFKGREVMARNVDAQTVRTLITQREV